ncbi:MAG TPA: NAD(P)-dependent oxidoreductase [Geomonas sp.]|nr:NAD(P)-dependent oxidoreductase [Geomonas sp.]
MKILIASSIDAAAIERLKTDHQVVCAFQDVSEGMLRELVADCQVLVFRSGVNISAQLMECAPHLKLLVRAGSGLDNLDFDYVQRRGLKLVRIPQPGARAVTELTFALMLALSRRLFEADRSMRDSHWSKDDLSGYLLQGKTLGVVGAGNIGGCVAQMGIAWGMRVLGCVEHPSWERRQLFAEKGIDMVGFKQVLAEADYVTVHVPLKEDTRHMFDQAAFSLMKKGAYLVNVARGGVVDELALHEALTGPGRLRGAALDVHAKEWEGGGSLLAGCRNVILTPHVGSMTVDTQAEIGRRVVEAIEEFAAETSIQEQPGAWNSYCIVPGG